MNIAFVTQLGDCVQNANIINEWAVADSAFGLLENPLTTALTDGLPFGVAVGNHDQIPVGNPAPQSTTENYNTYFGEARFLGRVYYGGNDGVHQNDNHFQLFDAGGMKFIIIHLEYDPTGPEQNVLNWADDLLANQYADRRAIVASHHVLQIGNPGDFSVQGQTDLRRAKK